jgi:transglutaminase-like putative cysteine protease
VRPADSRRPLGAAGVVGAVGEAPLHWDFEILGYDARALFLPQRTKRVRCETDALFVDDQGQVTADTGVPRYQVDSAWAVGTTDLRRARVVDGDRSLLSVPPGVLAALRPHLPPRHGAGLDASVDALQAYFHGGFRYTLFLPSVPAEVDPVVAFVERREGHCELFASAAVLFLRMWGVPARLAGGVRCSERTGPGAYQARLRNAHAWVEVPTHEFGWVALDFTPPDADAVGEDPSAAGEDGGGEDGLAAAGGFDWRDPFKYGPQDREAFVSWVGARARAEPVLWGGGGLTAACDR